MLLLRCVEGEPNKLTRQLSALSATAPAAH
jgi:hypothetical protein